jgi:hypothetical protein
MCILAAHTAFRADAVFGVAGRIHPEERVAGEARQTIAMPGVTISLKGASGHSDGVYDFHANGRSHRRYYWRCWLSASGAAARFCGSGHAGECGGAGSDRHGGACSGK